MYRDAGKAVLAGHALYGGPIGPNGLPFSYPPFAGLLSTLLVPLGADGSTTVMWLMNAAAGVLACGLALRLTQRRGLLAWGTAAALAGAAALVVEPVVSNADFGQVNLVLFLLVLADVVVVPPRYRGVLTGVAAASKLTPAVFVVWFALRRDWPAVRRAAVAFVACALVAVAILPGDSLRYWFHEALAAGRMGNLGYVSNQSWEGVLHRARLAGTGENVEFAGLVAVTSWLAFGVVSRLAKQGRTLDAMVALSLVGVLASPVSWTHHWAWVVIVPIALAELPRSEPWTRATLGLLLVVTIAHPYWWGAHSKLGWFGANSLVLSGALVLVAWRWDLRDVEPASAGIRTAAVGASPP